MKKRLCHLALVFIALTMSVGATAQQKTITGRVLDAGNKPLQGVTVSVKNKKNTATTTGPSGDFSISASSGDVLVFSSVGYGEFEEKVGSANSINVNLSTQITSMNEVVVVGYGTQQRKDITGSVVSVSTKDLPQVANTSINNLLQGRAAGLNLNLRSAQPGGGLSVNIRGGGAPLYVVDGVPLFNNRAPEPSVNDKDLGYYGGVDRDPLSTINPSDIETIDVLKDASAAAIYGSAAANGVILITTKKGKANKTTTEYRGSYTAQTPMDYYDLLSAKEFMQQQVRLAKDKFLYDNNLAPYGTSSATPVFTPLFTQSQIDAAGQGTDWVDMLIRPGSIQEHNIAVSGGTEKTRIYTSFNYYNNKAIVENSDFARYTGRINLEQQINDRIKLSVNMTMSQINSNNAASGSNSGGQEKYNEIQAATSYVPTVSVFDNDGNYQKSLNRLITNPAAFFIITDKLKTNRFFVAPNLEFKILDNLKFNVVGGIDKQSSQRKFFMPRKVQNYQLPDGMAQLSTSNIGNYSVEGYGTYNTTFGDHSLTIVGGGGYYKNFNDNNGLQAVGFFTDAINVYDVSLASNKDKSFVNSFRSIDFIKISQFFRANYSYKSKYILTINARRDGSTVFAENKKWGFFPGISGAWRISDESFMSGIKVISDLKLRAGYGTVGNDAGINALALYSTGGGNFLIGSTFYPSVALSQLANPDLSWETDKSINIGLDFGLLNNRITGAIDVFRRDATDLLSIAVLPSNNAVNRLNTNLGATRSQGIEFTINSKNTTGPLKWETSFNISTYKNNWQERSPYVALQPYQQAQDRLDVTYGWQTNGIIKEIKDRPSYMPNAKLGNVIYVDQNNDGVLDVKDVVALGNRDPKWIFGMANRLSFKNFDLNIFIYGKLKQYMDNNYSGFYAASRLAVPDALNTLVGIRDVWTADNPTGTLPGIASNPYGGSNPSGSNDFYQQNVNFLRLRNITLGYTFATKKIIHSARVFVDVQNVGVWTNYKGYDPEITEANPYPQALSTTFGVNINF
ncbi:MAG: SusC/RagA family TonB-linked outer membrane protein [Chitinophagaceae bacterium]